MYSLSGKMIILNVKNIKRISIRRNISEITFFSCDRSRIRCDIWREIFDNDKIQWKIIIYVFIMLVVISREREIKIDIRLVKKRKRKNIIDNASLCLSQMTKETRRTAEKTFSADDEAAKPLRLSKHRRRSRRGRRRGERGEVGSCPCSQSKLSRGYAFCANQVTVSRRYRETFYIPWIYALLVPFPNAGKLFPVVRQT